MLLDGPEFPHSILIADNTAELRAAMADIFRGDNYRLVLAVDGNDALEKAKTQYFDLVVTGILMPGLDGIELLAALRKFGPHPPVIVVAEGKSDIDTIYLRCAVLLGAAMTFKRPLDPLSFLRDVRAVILQGHRDALRHRGAYR